MCSAIPCEAQGKYDQKENDHPQNPQATTPAPPIKLT